MPGQIVALALTVTLLTVKILGLQWWMNETAIQQRIRGILNNRLAPTRLWRNNVGSWKDEKTGRWVEYGLAVGSADLVGIERRLITPAMVGSTVGVFLAVEVKTPIGRLSKEQKAWLGAVRSLGGNDQVMRSEDDATRFLESLAVA